MQEYFKNRINERALGWIRVMLDTIYNANPLVESSNNAQDTAQKDYADRFFYELFQNAKDVSGCTKIKIISLKSHNFCLLYHYFLDFSSILMFFIFRKDVKIFPEDTFVTRLPS